MRKELSIDSIESAYWGRLIYIRKCCRVRRSQNKRNWFSKFKIQKWGKKIESIQRSPNLEMSINGIDGGNSKTIETKLQSNWSHNHFYSYLLWTMKWTPYAKSPKTTKSTNQLNNRVMPFRRRICFFFCVLCNSEIRSFPCQISNFVSYSRPSMDCRTEDVTYAQCNTQQNHNINISRLKRMNSIEMATKSKEK